ncbi:MAG TPA: DUF1800 domain-containing protein [Candidatus Sulfotelmatobacter sp.]|nr:DUF1800 domain-containing protein [Candidatus Sulfotelmatobacter sp.]
MACRALVVRIAFRCAGALFTGAVLLTYCGAAAAAGGRAALTPRQQALHVLDRLAFGPRPGDVDRVVAMGVDRYIDQQLHPESIPESPAVAKQLAAMPTLQLGPETILARDVWPGRGADVAALIARKRQIDHDVNAQRYLRAVESPRQLQEVMVDFWFNHFNVFCCDKGVIVRPLLGSYELQAIRPHVLGRFRNLLGATAHHPAMLTYLDNSFNIVHRNEGGDARPRGLNENYARELMELHTLGADGGYAQADVMALARILSGWRLPPPNDIGRGTHGFYFDAAAHAPGDKRFLGRVIAAGGEREGEQALDMLAASPATARHIAFQLAQYFVADDPDPRLVDLLARRFAETGGDIRAVLTTLFHSAAFWQPANVGNKFKTPYQYVISAIRATGQPIADGAFVGEQVAAMGEPLYGKATPDGYKNTAAAWLSPDALIQRIVFADRLAAGQLPLQRPFAGVMPAKPTGGAPALAAMPVSAKGPPGEPVDEAALRATLDGLFSAHTLGTVAREQGALRSAMLLASPEFMMR